MAERLYAQDAYLREFDARVISCVKNGEKWETVLSRTAFFPEGGGQGGDRGFIGDAEVEDTVERAGEVIHICRAPVELGEVNCVLDFDNRFLNMQQHTGEHIFSGLIHSITGFDNVGFHMGSRFVTVDFNGVVAAEELERAERLANAAIYRNIPVEEILPRQDEVELYSYRSKKEIDGQLRLIKIDGCDLCACCGTHVARTGEVGIVKAIGMINYKSGVRITLQVGSRALADYDEKNKALHAAASLLSAKPEEITDAVEKLLEQLAEQKAHCAELHRRLFANICAQSGGLVFEPGLEAQNVRILCDMLADAVAPAAAAVFSGSDEAGYKYAIACRAADARPMAKALADELGARGGGKPEMVQGTVNAARSEIERFCIADLGFKH